MFKVDQGSKFPNDERKVAGAIRTDFILSAEIIVIALGTVTGASLVTQILVVSLIARSLDLCAKTRRIPNPEVERTAMHVRKPAGFPTGMAKANSEEEPFARGFSAFGRAAHVSVKYTLPCTASQAWRPYAKDSPGINLTVPSKRTCLGRRSRGNAPSQ